MHETVLERMLTFVKVLWDYIWGVSHTHELVKEYKEVTAHILGYLVRCLALKVILDVLL